MARLYCGMHERVRRLPVSTRSAVLPSSIGAMRHPPLLFRGDGICACALISEIHAVRRLGGGFAVGVRACAWMSGAPHRCPAVLGAMAPPWGGLLRPTRVLLEIRKSANMAGGPVASAGGQQLRGSGKLVIQRTQNRARDMQTNRHVREVKAGLRDYGDASVRARRMLDPHDTEVMRDRHVVRSIKKDVVGYEHRMRMERIERKLSPNAKAPDRHDIWFNPGASAAQRAEGAGRFKPWARDKDRNEFSPRNQRMSDKWERQREVRQGRERERVRGLRSHTLPKEMNRQADSTRGNHNMY